MGSIGTSVQSLVAQRIFGQNRQGLHQSLMKLSTGLRINRGADDPAGLIASENLRATLASLEAETRAMERTDHVVRSADAALEEVSGLINRAEELAVANANTGAMSDAEREANQLEMDSIIQSVNRIAHSAGFNGNDLLDGSLTISGGGQSIDVASAAASDIGGVADGSESYSLADLASGGDLSLSSGDSELISDVIRQARMDIAFSRGSLGSFSSFTLQPSIRSNQSAFVQTASAESMIRDTDYASESSNLVRFQVLQSSSLSVLGTANQQPSVVIGLL
ncbi:MAG: flagellin [Planctomycetota bacterium]|jgi:flagellin